MKNFNGIFAVFITSFCAVTACEVEDSSDQLLGNPSINGGHGSSEWTGDVPIVDSGSDVLDSSYVQDSTIENAQDSSDSCVQESDNELCEKSGKNCGTIYSTDACGYERVVASCGECQSQTTCVNGKCIGSCVPKTCAGEAFTCGYMQDGCGNLISCGKCPSDGTELVCATAQNQTSGTCKEYSKVCGNDPKTKYMGSCTKYDAFFDDVECTFSLVRSQIVEKWNNITLPTPNYNCPVDYTVTHNCSDGGTLKLKLYSWSATPVEHVGSVGGIAVGTYMGNIGLCEENVTWFFPPKTMDEIKNEALLTEGARFISP